MGAAVSSYGAAVRSLVTKPRYLVAAVVTAVLYFVLATVLQQVPVVGSLLHWLVVVPLLNAGLIGMAYAISEYGSGPFSAYLGSIRDNATSMIGGHVLSYIVAAALFFVLIILVVILTTIVGAGILASAGEPFTSTGNPADYYENLDSLAALFTGIGLVAILLYLLAFLLFAVVLMMLQFVGPAVVVGGRGAGSAVGKSVSLFAAHPLSVFVYTVLRVSTLAVLAFAPAFLLGVGAGAGGGPLFEASMSPGFDLSSPRATLGTLLTFVGFPVGYGFFVLYHTAYYYRITDGDRTDDRPAPHERDAPGGRGPPQARGGPQGGGPQGYGQPQGQGHGGPQGGGGPRQSGPQGYGDPQGRGGPQARGGPQGQGGHPPEEGGHQPRDRRDQPPRGGGPRSGADRPPGEDRPRDGRDSHQQPGAHEPQGGRGQPPGDHQPQDRRGQSEGGGPHDGRGGDRSGRDPAGSGRQPDGPRDAQPGEAADRGQPGEDVDGDQSGPADGRGDESDRDGSGAESEDDRPER